jgi:hypothetical protein
MLEAKTALGVYAKATSIIATRNTIILVIIFHHLSVICLSRCLEIELP